MTAAVLLRAAVLSAAAALLVSKVAGQLQIEELGPEIRIPQGTVRGSTIFFQQGPGIPYAEPPIGGLRFRRSRGHRGWEGVLSATSFAPPCPQPSASQRVKDNMDEDCLFVNIWTAQVEPQRKNPVVVFFEGQLFTLSNPSDVPAEDLVNSRPDIVFVSVAYRTTAFGFLALEGVSDDNVGLHDQRLALEWVRDNIVYFGGDPTRVSLSGHSAGAASAFFHLAARDRTGEYASAIFLSGPANAPWATARSRGAAEENSMDLARELGCVQAGVNQSSSGVAECMQSRSVLSIVAAIDDAIVGGNTSRLFLPFPYSPEDGGEFFALDAEAAAKEGRIRVPVLFSSVVSEGHLMAYFLKAAVDSAAGGGGGGGLRGKFEALINDTLLPPALARIIQDDNSEDLLKQLIEMRYFSSLASGPIATRGGMHRAVSKFCGDFFFQAPAERLLRLLSETNFNVYFAVNTLETRDPQDIFDSSIPEPRSSHGEDLLYLFGPAMFRSFLPERIEGLPDPRQQFPTFAEERLGRNLKAVFGDFAANGRPPAGLDWDAYSPRERTFFDVFQGRAGAGFQPEAYKFWYELIPQIAEKKEESLNADVLQESRMSSCSAYFVFTWLLLAATLILLLLLIFVIALFGWRRLRRKPSLVDGEDEFDRNHLGRSDNDGMRRRGSVFTVSESVLHGRQREDLLDQDISLPVPQSRGEDEKSRRRTSWRDSVMDDYRI